MNDLGVETWLMHGTLLGWWWNRKILPWDSDSDVQMSEKSMTYLATFYNMTVFHYKTPRIPDGRDYMLEINPHYVNREQTDKMNVIDARWIDTSSGLFIDMTTARYNYTHPAGEGMLSCKDGHEYRDTYIFPLRDTYFEGTPAKIPFAYKEVLEAEYGPKSLTLKDYADHRFDDQKLEWIPMPKPLKKPEDQKVITPPKKVEEKKVEVKKPEEKKPEEKKPEEKKPEEKKPEEKKPEVKKAEEKKVEEKKPEQAAQKEAQTTLATKTRAAILKVRESSPPTVNPPSPPPKI
ncbi:putative protein MNN4 [Glarea lozoyensis 74030]|uniref:LicD/FKTN/FKRP nucleotidyltransferase domain-containing protein n=1 Tax=Glarea lozoyensis (strain ATCC 74030 / MF5533) TaxID=1104152 RepID=H0EGY3_GLAL7|nr:putative protein MNN4 [Glarea lozoyensis 74030]